MVSSRDKGKKNSWVINDDAAKVVVDVFEEYVKDGCNTEIYSFGYYCQNMVNNLIRNSA